MIAINDVKLKAFSSWAQSMLSYTLRKHDWTRGYIEKAWQSGSRAAQLDTKTRSGVQSGVDALEQFAANEIDGIAAATAQKLSRMAARMIQRRVPKASAWRCLADEFDAVGPPRLCLMADFEKMDRRGLSVFFFEDGAMNLINKSAIITGE
jgi:hypothetical protein